MNDITKNRHGGNSYSNGAQKERGIKAAKQRARVRTQITLAGKDGLTVDECAEKFGVPPNQVSGRFTELKALRMIEKHGSRKTRTGSLAGVWVAKEVVS